MSHVAYPAQFPADCIGALIQIVRGGFDQLIARKAEVGLHVWNLQGFGQAILLGTPDGPFHAMSADEEANVQERLEEFSKEFAACCPDRVSEAALVDSPGLAAGKIDWAKWIRFFLEVVLPLILTI